MVGQFAALGRGFGFDLGQGREGTLRGVPRDLAQVAGWWFMFVIKRTRRL